MAAALAALPPGTDVYEVPIAQIDGPGNKQSNLAACLIATTILALIAVILRFSIRLAKKLPLYLDDWLMLPALACSLTIFSVAFWALAHGNGKYVGTVTFGKLEIILTELFISELVYSFTIGFVKFSILALYWRLFPKQWMKISCSVLGAVTAGWVISNTAVICLQCQPINGFWDKTVPAACNVNVKAFLIGAAIINIVTDVVMLSLPIFLCMRLQQSRLNKILLVGVFATGSLVTIISIVRLVAIVQLNLSDTTDQLNVTWSFAEVSLWTEVEQNLAIVSGCLPCLKPLFNGFLPASLLPRYMRKSKPSSKTPGSGKAQNAGSSGRKLWAKGSSSGSKKLRGPFTELLETENHDSTSQLALEDIGCKKSVSRSSLVGVQRALKESESFDAGHEVGLQRVEV